MEKPQAIAPISPYSQRTRIVIISIMNPNIIMNSRLEGEGSPKPYTLVNHEKSELEG